MRVLFLGSGSFGLPTLAHLHRTGELIAVISQPDRPAGRNRRLEPTPVADWAVAVGLPVLKSGDVNTPHFAEQVAACRADASVVIAFGQKLSPQFIGVLGDLAVNVHASLLPKYRGAAPVNWAMINRETVTGLSVIGLAQRMDAGDIYARAELTIDPAETAGELEDRLAELAPPLIARVLSDHQGGALHGAPQDEGRATRAPKLTKADGSVDFNQPADAVRARIHGLTPWPGCRVEWTCRTTGKTNPLVLRRAQANPSPPDFVQRHLVAGGLRPPGSVFEALHVMTAAGTIKLLEVQAPGTRVMQAAAFARGHRLGPGDALQPIRR